MVISQIMFTEISKFEKEVKFMFTKYQSKKIHRTLITQVSYDSPKHIVYEKLFLN